MRKMIFKQSITIEKLISKDMYGSGNYEEPVTAPTAIDYIIKNIKDFKGNDLITSAWIALPAGTELNLSDRITLPNGSKPYIGSIAPVFNYRNG